MVNRLPEFTIMFVDLYWYVLKCLGHILLNCLLIRDFTTMLYYCVFPDIVWYSWEEWILPSKLKKHENIVYHRVRSKKREEESRRENERRTREKTCSLRLNAALFPLFIMVPIPCPQPPDNCATSREIHESPTTPSSARASNRDLVQTDGVSEFQRWSRPGARSQASYEKPHTLGLPAR